MQTQEFGQHEPVMIISSDKDFIQLQRHGHVIQWSPLFNKMVKDPDPVKYLFEHLLKGDTGDGVPNVLSQDDTFMVEGGKQTPLRQTRIDEWISNAENLRDVMPEEIYRNYQRNKTLIDLTCSPEELRTEILDTFKEAPENSRNKILNYFIKQRLKTLTESIGEF